MPGVSCSERVKFISSGDLSQELCDLQRPQCEGSVLHRPCAGSQRDDEFHFLTAKLHDSLQRFFSSEIQFISSLFSLGAIQEQTAPFLKAFGIQLYFIFPFFTLNQQISFHVSVVRT